MDKSSFKRLEGISKLNQELNNFLDQNPKEITDWGGSFRSKTTGNEIDIKFQLLILVKKK